MGAARHGLDLGGYLLLWWLHVWRFAGHLCYGSLLPAQESKTHCYARTHKGNTKTLTKGGASWWMEN